MSAVETANYIQAAGTFAGVDPPPPPIPANGVIAQQGFTSFTRNGPGDYTLGLQESIGFLEAEVRVQPGVNQLVVIGGQVDPDTARVQVRCYDTLGNPADCQIFTVQVLKIAVGPVALPPFPLPAPPAPVVVGGGLCLQGVPPGNVQALVGQNVVVSADFHTGVTAPANPVDCDQFAVTFLPVGNSPIGSVPIVGFAGEVFNPSGGTTVRIMAGTMVFQFTAGAGVWWVVDSPIVQPDGGTNGLAVAFNAFALVSDNQTLGIIDWLTGANNTTNRWKASVYLTDQASGDIAQFFLQATFRRDGASVVTQKTVVFMDSIAQGTIAAATVQFSIAAQTVTLEVSSVIGVAGISAQVFGQVIELFG